MKYCTRGIQKKTIFTLSNKILFVQNFILQSSVSTSFIGPSFNIQNGTLSLVSAIPSKSDNIDLFHCCSYRLTQPRFTICRLSLNLVVSEQRLGPSFVADIHSNRKYITIEFRIRSSVIGFDTSEIRSLNDLENGTGQRAILEIGVTHDLQAIC